MTNDSIKLAQLWLDLQTMKNKLDNEIIPISSHLQVDDDALINAMEELSASIAQHFEKFKLTAEVKRTKPANNAESKTAS